MYFDKFLLAVESCDLISSWKNYYKSVFFPKYEWWVAELLFLSLYNWGLNFLQNECSKSSQIYLSPEKQRKMFTFQYLQIFEWQNWPKPKVFFGITVNFSIQNSFGKRRQLEIDHVTQQPKETTCRGPMLPLLQHIFTQIIDSYLYFSQRFMILLAKVAFGNKTFFL